MATEKRNICKRGLGEGEQVVWKNEGDCLRKGLSRPSTGRVCKDRGSILQTIEGALLEEGWEHFQGG